MAAALVANTRRLSGLIANHFYHRVFEARTCCVTHIVFASGFRDFSVPLVGDADRSRRPPEAAIDLSKDTISIPEAIAMLARSRRTNGHPVCALFDVMLGMRAWLSRTC